MRVAHILPWKSVGGVEIGTLRICRLTRPEVENVAFCVDGDSPVPDLFRSEGFEVVSFTPATPSLLRRFPAYLRDSLRIAAKFREARIDIVYCADLLAAYQAAFAGRLARLPVICHMRGRHQLNWRDRIFVGLVNQFVFVSQSTLASFPRKLPPRKATVIYDAVEPPVENHDVDLRSEFGLRPDAKVIGMVARIAPVKDHLSLVRAAAEIVKSHPEVHFLLIGDTAGQPGYVAHYELVRSEIARLRLSEHFTFTGHRSDVPRLVSGLDVFVLATHREGLPLAIVEAMLMGTPVVATGIDGIPEIIENQKTGFLVPPSNPDALAEALLCLLNNPAVAERYGVEGRDFVSQRFSAVPFQKSILSVYSSLVRR